LRFLHFLEKSGQKDLFAVLALFRKKWTKRFICGPCTF